MNDVLRMRRDMKQLMTELDAIKLDSNSSVSDRNRANELMDQVEEIRAQIKTVERGFDLTEGLDRPADEDEERGYDPRQDRVERTGNADSEAGYRQFGMYLQAVARASRSIGDDPIAGLPSGHVAPELRDIMDREARAATGLSEGVPSDGGFAVGKQQETEIMSRIYDSSYILNNARKYDISPPFNGIKLPGIDEASRADGSRQGGVRAYWTNEADAMTASKPKMRQISMDLEKLTCLVYGTDELLQDAAALGRFVQTAAVEELSFKFQNSAINGDGSGKPLGILNANCLVSQAAENSQVATTIVYENIVKMWSRMWGPSRARSVWLCNSDIVPQLMTMSLAVGVGGSAVFMPSGGASARPFDTLFGRPIVYVEACPTLGTLGDIILADLNEYLVIKKADIQSASSIHVRFVNNETVFRFVMRINAQPTWTSALTPFKGSATVGPFVALATRS